MKAFHCYLALMLSASAVGGECKDQLDALLASKTREGIRQVLDLCQAEAKAGDAASSYHLSSFYFGGIGVPIDELEAVRLVRQSAEWGYPLAQFWMGWQSELGEHVPKDNDAALQWYEKAAQAGQGLAMDRLEKAYRTGELGLAVDHRRAKTYAREPCGKDL